MSPPGDTPAQSRGCRMRRVRIRDVQRLVVLAVRILEVDVEHALGRPIVAFSHLVALRLFAQRDAIDAHRQPGLEERHRVLPFSTTMLSADRAPDRGHGGPIDRRGHDFRHDRGRVPWPCEQDGGGAEQQNHGMNGTEPALGWLEEGVDHGLPNDAQYTTAVTYPAIAVWP